MTRVQHWDDLETIQQETTRQSWNSTSQDFEGCFDQWNEDGIVVLVRVGSILKGKNRNIENHD